MTRTRRTRPTVPQPGDLVIVKWDDIHEDPGWQSTEHPEGGVRVCETVGWVVKFTRSRVVLTRTYGVDQGAEPGTIERKAGDAMSFPRGCVTGWEIVRAKAG